MSRVRSTASYGHRIQWLGSGWGYRLIWIVDRHYNGSRLRHPRRCCRDTGDTGAKRFAARWGIEITDGPAAAKPAAKPEEKNDV